MSAPAFGASLSRRQTIAVALRRLLEEPPKLHRAKDYQPGDPEDAEDGLVSTWGIQGSFLEFLVETLSGEGFSLETGSGLSTVCFAMIGSEHICVSPFQKEHNRIRNYCSRHGISTERIRFIPMKSHAALPTLDLGGRKLDFALIDGSHTFPEPIIDYYYVNKHLKVGGFLAIDDLNISSVGILHKFLITEPAYELVRFDALKTGVYQKVRNTCYIHGWLDQNFNSTYPDFSYLPLQTRVRDKLRPLELKLRIGLGKLPGVRRAYHLLRDHSTSG
jgi:hypothetical protein